eukprot:15881-Karenia_brevis.AAC.1
MEQEHEEEMTQRIKERKEKQRFQGKDSHKYMWKCPICPNWETGTVSETLPPKQRKKKVIALKMKHVKQCHPGQEKELRMRMVYLQEIQRGQRYTWKCKYCNKGMLNEDPNVKNGY